jgi:transglutaminase-like putative cysteine protease
LKVATDFVVETYLDNPFNYLLEPWMVRFPIDYPSSLLLQLQPYLKFSTSSNLVSRSIVDPAILELAQLLQAESDDNTVNFLFNLNQTIYENCQYIIRETGHCWAAGTTWGKRQGSCRDLAVLFMEVCRIVGLAARFVSGYQEGDLDNPDKHLHAWAEVYLAGAGWRGYDPSHGLAVGDSYIALVASAIPSYTAPIQGDLTPLPTSTDSNGAGQKTTMSYELSIQRLP